MPAICSYGVKKTRRNHDVHTVGAKRVAVHIQSGTMTLDEAARLAVDISQVVADAQPDTKTRKPRAID